MTKQQMQKAGKSELEILQAEVDAAWEIIETLPVDAHDMGVHFWCTWQWCDAVDEEE